MQRQIMTRRWWRELNCIKKRLHLIALSSSRRQVGSRGFVSQLVNLGLYLVSSMSQLSPEGFHLVEFLSSSRLQCSFLVLD